MKRCEKFRELHMRLMHENAMHNLHLESCVDIIRLSAEYDEQLAQTRQYNQEYKHNKEYSRCTVVLC